MKKIEILAPCVCAGRNVERGVLLDPKTVPASDLAILTGSGLAREVDRYEVRNPAVVNPDPFPVPAKKKSVKK